MSRRLLPLLLSGALPLFAGAGQERYVADFETGADPARYEGLDTSGADASIVPGPNGHCLQLRTREPAGFCGCNLTREFTVEKNLVLSFDHREEIESGYEGAYLGISFFVGREQWFWTSHDFSGDWRHADVPIANLASSSAKKVSAGLVISRVQIYGRVKEKTPVKGETKARMTVWLDNVRLGIAEPKSRLTDETRTSYANPPMFQWPLPRPASRQKLQYSQVASFPPGDTTTIETAANFHTPPAPIGPGTFFWRVWSSDDLAEGWSDIKRVLIPQEAHRFATRAISISELDFRPRPRLAAVARLRETNPGEKRSRDLLKASRKLYERGVPEHPGPHVPGDPRWPTWIEWYGKVAGGITGGTGRRLEEIGRAAAITGDPQIVEWAKHLVLKACTWDPEGGSAMRLGDIGAHHLLRGLNWCYDACRDSLSPAERQTVASMIARRAEQFHKRLNPFRHGEANNHAWLQALGLAESGVVLSGDRPEAAEWAEYVRQLYVGRFLPCLGYQGDNNEGIGYWDYGLSFIVEYADLMRAVCAIDLYEHPWLKQTARFPMYCAPPNAWAVSFADTGMPNHGTLGPACTKRVRDLALRTRDPYALWYSGERNSVDGLAPLVPHDLTPSIHYRHIGVAIFNTSLVDGREGVTVAMHSGPYQAGHQHPDQNSFVIHAYGEKLAIDGGYYDWYGSPHFKEYSMNTMSHNTILVNGRGQAACTEGADGRITSWFDSAAYGHVVGDASDPDIYRGAIREFERGILFIKPGFVAIRDRIGTSGKSASCDWLLHAIAPVELGGHGSFVIDRPQAALRGTFLLPDKVRIDVTTGFPVEPVNRYSRDPVPKDNYFPEWTLHAKSPATGASQDFSVVMQVQRKGQRPQPPATIEPMAAQRAQAARISVADKTHLILWRSAESPAIIAAGPLQTDGTCASLELDSAGMPVAGFMANGTSLRCNGRNLIQLKTPASAAFP